MAGRALYVIFFLAPPTDNPLVRDKFENLILKAMLGVQEGAAALVQGVEVVEDVCLKVFSII